MNDLSLFDLHCDTACEMLATAQPLADNTLAISLKKSAAFDQYVQVMALWADHTLSDAAAWERVSAMAHNLLADPSLKSNRARLTTTCPPREDGVSLLLGLEDARILEGRLERVDDLYRLGVRILTPLWRGETCIGGAHDTENGLTEFGKAAVRHALDLGMLPDISHASVASAEDLFELAAEYNRPVLASHSDAYAVCAVSRNLRDDQARAVIRSGGLIGLNLYTRFLSADAETVTVEDVFRHAEHFLSIGAERTLSLGCDMDGAAMPRDLHDLSALPNLAECFLRHNFSESLVRDIFFENAFRIFRQAFP